MTPEEAIIIIEAGIEEVRFNSSLQHVFLALEMAKRALEKTRKLEWEEEEEDDE